MRVAPAAAPDEAAAIAAAVEQFLADTAPAAVAGEGTVDRPPGSAWKRAALLEGVEQGPFPG